MKYDLGEIAIKIGVSIELWRRLNVVGAGLSDNIWFPVWNKLNDDLEARTFAAVLQPDSLESPLFYDLGDKLILRNPQGQVGCDNLPWDRCVSLLGRFTVNRMIDMLWNPLLRIKFRFLPDA